MDILRNERRRLMLDYGREDLEALAMPAFDA
jgi:hypothetical protein